MLFEFNSLQRKWLKREISTIAFRRSRLRDLYVTGYLLMSARAQEAVQNYTMQCYETRCHMYTEKTIGIQQKFLIFRKANIFKLKNNFHKTWRFGHLPVSKSIIHQKCKKLLSGLFNKCFTFWWYLNRRVVSNIHGKRNHTWWFLYFKYLVL